MDVVIKKITIGLFLALLCSGAYSQSKKSVDGEGRFYAKDEDSLSFIKSQLLHSAFSDVITKELKFLGLDAAQFWKSYDEKFEKYFEPIKEQLQKKHGMMDKPSQEQRKKYNKSHRLKRLKLKSKYGRLDRAVTSYSIKKMTRSPQLPNSRYINLSAKVDRSHLKKIYFQIISDSVDREIKTIFVTANFDINDLNWSDLGVELENDFTSVIKEHWRKWLSENLKTRFADIRVTEPSKEKELEEFLKAPKEATADLFVETVENPEEPQPINEFKDGLWLKINIDLSKVKEDFLMKERAYELSGDFILLDLNSEGIVHSFDIAPVKTKYSFDKGAPLSTNLATWVYRTVSGGFDKFDKKIAAIPAQNKSVDLVVTGAQSYLDFERVSEMLALKGSSMRFATKLLSYEGGKGKIRLKYTGDKESLVNTLDSFGDLKIDETKTLARVGTDSPFNFQLISEPVEGTETPVNEEENNEQTAQ